MRALRRATLVVLALLGAILALVGMLTIFRGTPVRTVLPAGIVVPLPAVGDSLFAHTMELFSGTELVPGNQVEILSNGDGTYGPLWNDLRSARRTITAQMYFAKPGAVADTFATILAERARAGVSVLLLLDAFGSQTLLRDREWVRRLTASGVVVRRLRPIRWLSLHKAAHRSHARAIVVDGAIGYTGGFGLADYWLGNGRKADEWRETNVRFAGPAVQQLQAAFMAGWGEATGELPVGDAFFTPPSVTESTSGVVAGLMHTAPTVGSTPAERFLALSISGARRSLFITNSYFVPDDDLRRLLVAAVRRGVDVRVLTAGPRTDVRTTWWAGRRHYEELLAGGVRLYEYQPTMMHAKSFVVDGQWVTVGSMNFDNRSVAFNNETNLNVLDRRTGAVMDSLFRADLHYAREIRLAEWRRRPWWQRPLERGAALLSRVL